MDEGNLDLLRDTAREFARDTIGPVVMKHDEAHSFHGELVRPMAGLGFMGAMVPEKFGGADVYSSLRMPSGVAPARDTARSARL